MNETEKRLHDRVWEIDALRGLLILSVLCVHLYTCVDAFCIDGYYNIDSYVWVNTTDPLHFWFDWDADGKIYRALFSPKIWTTGIWSAWNYTGVQTFFILSGISCVFSRNNLRRGLITLGAGLFIAVFTYGLAYWTGDPTRFIRFGVLFCYAGCQLIYYYLLEKRSNETLFFVAAIVFAIGYYLRYHGVEPTRLPIFYIFGVHQIGDQSSDYWPLFPMLGWFLVGSVFGRKYYSEKKTLIPVPLADKITRPLQWLGRHSGIIYVSHIVVYTVLFCSIGYLFHLL